MNNLYRLLLAILILSSVNITRASAQTACFTAVDTACINLASFAFTNCSSGALSYLWDFGDGLGTSTLTNPSYDYFTSGPGTYTVSLTACDGPNQTGNCDIMTLAVTVYDLPTAVFSVVGNTVGCGPFQVCFADNSVAGSGPVVNWLWDFGNGAFNNTGDPNPCYEYPSFTIGSFVVALEVTDVHGCTDDTVNIATPIDNHAGPIAGFTTPAVIGGIVACNPNALVAYTDASIPGTGSITNWDWTFQGGTPATGTGTNPTTTYNTAGTFTVELVVTDDNGCMDTITQTVSVDEHSANTGFTASSVEGCDKLIVNFFDTTGSLAGSANQWAWDFSYDGVTFMTESTFGPSTATFYSSPGSYSVAMVSINAAGCIDTAIYIDFITVHAVPNAVFTADTLASCSMPFAVNFTDATAGASSWIWDMDNEIPPPNPPGYDWSTDYTTQTVTHSFTDTGCYNVSLIVVDTNGCIDTAKYDDLICISAPVADFFADIIMDTNNLISPYTAEGCVPLKIHFKSLSNYDGNVLNDSIVSWFWDFGDGNTIQGQANIPDSTNNCQSYCEFQNPTHIYVDTGTFDVILVVTTAKGCTDTVYMNETFACQFLGGPCEVKAGVPPTANFSMDDTLGSFPLTVYFTELSSSYANEWTWDFGDGATSTAQNPMHTFQSGIGNFSVGLIAGFNGCQGELKVVSNAVEVEGPMAQFDTRAWKDSAWTNDWFFCYEDSTIWGGWKIEIRDSSFGAENWVWNFGDTNSTYAINTTLTQDYDTLFISGSTIVIPNDTTTFQAGDTAICNNTYEIVMPGETSIIPNDTLAPNSAFELIYITGDLMHTLGMGTSCVQTNTPDTMNQYLYMIIPASDTIIDTVYTIYRSVEYDTTLANTLFLGCTFEWSVPFSVDTILPPVIITSYASDIPYYAPYDSVGITTTQSITSADTVQISSHQELGFTAPGIVVIGSDTTFISWSGILIDTTTFVLAPDSNCYGIENVPSVTIFPDTVILAGSTLPSGFCDLLVIPADTIIDPPAAIVLDSINKAMPFTHTYQTPGTKTIWLYTWRTCATCPDSLYLDSTMREVYISKIDAEFSINALSGGSTEGCGAPTFVFMDESTTIYDSIQRIWDFGDGFTLVSPTFPFLDNPIIPAVHPSVCQPSGSTTGSYKQVAHVYCNPGIYDVKMTIIDIFGCKDSVVHQVTVLPIPVPSYVADPLSGCANDMVQPNLEVIFTDTVTYQSQPSFWVWNYGDGTLPDTTYIPMTTHEYDICGTFPASLTTSVNGCQNFPVVSAFVSATCPVASFVPSAATACTGTPVTFISTSTGAIPLTYYWDWCDGAPVDTTSSTSIVHTFNVDTTTSFNVMLTVVDANGCIDTVSYTHISSKPVANFYSYPIDIDPNCPKIFEFADSSSIDVVNYFWDFGDGFTSPLAPPVSRTYTWPGCYTITLYVTSAFGCMDTIVKPNEVCIKGAVLLDTSMIDSGSCAPYAVTFSATAYNSNSYTWIFGDGNDTTVVTNGDPLNPVTTTVVMEHVYTVGGTFYPILIIEDPPDSSGVVCPYQFAIQPIVVPGPQIGFNASATIAPPGIISFTDTSINSQDIVLWYWDFGDGYSITGLGNVPQGTNDSLTSGTYNEPTHDYQNAGVYMVTFGGYVINVPDTCNYWVTDTITIVDTLISVEDIVNEKRYAVYPNPNGGTFTIELTGFSKEELNHTELLVRNIIGQKIPFESRQTKDRTMSLELKSVQRGIYFIEVLSPLDRVVLKVIVN